MTHRALTAAAAAAAALLLAGCDMQDPYDAAGTATTTDAAPAPAPAATAPPVTERPDDLAPAAPPRELPVETGAASTPERAARAYAERAVNWTWRSYGRQQRQLAALAAGRQREQLAASLPGPDQLAVLAEQKQTNAGRVIAVAPAVSSRGDRPATLYVLTLEQAGSGGFEDPNQRHGAYRASVTRSGGGWRLSAWSALP